MDFLTRLVQRQRSEPTGLQPVLPSRFEPDGPAQLEVETEYAPTLSTTIARHAPTPVLTAEPVKSTAPATLPPVPADDSGAPSAVATGAKCAARRSRSPQCPDSTVGAATDGQSRHVSRSRRLLGTAHRRSQNTRSPTVVTRFPGSVDGPGRGATETRAAGATGASRRRGQPPGYRCSRRAGAAARADDDRDQHWPH